MIIRVRAITIRRHAMGGYLRGTRVYLSGPIQFDSLPNWREQPKKTMIEKFGVHLFDPLDDPKQQWVPKLNAARDCKNGFRFD